MKKYLFSVFLIFIAQFCGAQNFRGQWKGFFIDETASPLSFGSNRCDYVIDLEVNGKEVTGYSYTYFSGEGKKYYTICTLTGSADQSAKTISIKEVARTKTNVPDNISNSFQLHKLRWRKDGENEILEGRWDPAPGQSRNTGYGTTMLMKRQLSEISPLAKKINAAKDPASSSPEKRVASLTKPKTSPAAAVKKSTAPPVASVAPTVKKITAPPTREKPVAESLITGKDSLKNTVAAKIFTPERSLPPNFDKRANALLQTVTVENPTVRIELYDNGDVDGDSVSLIYNNVVLLAHKRLTDRPILMELPVKNDESNELVMYADNLGTLPPNTALMIVYDGSKRYEVRVTSDLRKSGTIRFVHRSMAAKL